MINLCFTGDKNDAFVAPISMESHSAIISNDPPVILPKAPIAPYKRKKVIEAINDLVSMKPLPLNLNLTPSSQGTMHEKNEAAGFEGAIVLTSQTSVNYDEVVLLEGLIKSLRCLLKMMRQKSKRSKGIRRKLLYKKL